MDYQEKKKQDCGFLLWEKLLLEYLDKIRH